MDQTRGKHQHSLKSYKSPSLLHNLHHENSSYSMSTSPAIFKTSRLQRHSLKWRKDYHYRGNYRSKFPHRKIDFNCRKSNRTPEDVEEEERKKKLTDTAKKLLIKIKTWNAETNCTKDDSSPLSNISQVVNESSFKHSEDKINSDCMLKNTTHTKKGKLLKSRTLKSFSQTAKTKYDVNKETVKNFQNRIQHKLIEEIMQMPKENLQNVLNDPKINPIMELKMSRLVQENKLLIASKLRALAESKMKSLDCSTSSQLLVDIDKLIDPVIETDLSVLPFELIKQMENVFQVQFDYSHESASNGACDNAVTNVVTGEDVAAELNNLEQVVKVENNGDVSFYECSTDEDEDEDEDVCAAPTNSGQKKTLDETQFNKKNKKVKLSESYKPPSIFDCFSTSGENKEKESSQSQLFADNSLENSVSNQFSLKEPAYKTFTFISTSCQTECSSQDAFTQTPEWVECLYGIPLPKEATIESTSSLHEEVNSIQNLINKLNERRLMIFLQLARISPSGSFLGDDFTKKNFIEAASNGNLNLAESLKQFFMGRQQKSLGNRANYGKRRTFQKRKGESKLRLEKRANQG